MTENWEFRSQYNIFTCIGTVYHDNIHPCIKYYPTKLHTLLYVHVISKIMKFLSQNFMLTSERDRLRYNILLIKFCSKITKGRHQK